MISAQRRSRIRGSAAMTAAGVLTVGVAAGGSLALAAPPIRISASNPVPSCATPERLMAFLKSHNHQLDPRFRDIAAWYKKHGEAWRVRWDYAFFQMAIETNFLTYRRPGGRWGDVNPRQNNFAGIGTTGGGVPGDSYPDVPTGVLAQIQHLVVYSGERLADPVAPRTRLKQDDILSWTKPLAEKRPVTFQDLAGRWAADRKYGKSIDGIAQRFQQNHCRGHQDGTAARASGSDAPVQIAAAGHVVTPRPLPAVEARARPQAKSRLRVTPATRHPADNLPRAADSPATTSACRLLTASYGGNKTLLIRYDTPSAVEFTTLRVVDGFERSMAESFMKTYAPGGALIGEFASGEAALAKAYELCPSARPS
jgi:Mannosyl-glycoprotein endo-beta-N-acetylglucosaminidase